METSTNYSKTAGVRRADKSENTTLFRNVYLWMTMALFITGATALTVSDSPTLLNAIFGSKVAFFGLIIAELALVIILSSFIFRMSFLTPTRSSTARRWLRSSCSTPHRPSHRPSS